MKKIIHQCWVGPNPTPPLFAQWCSDWEKSHPDWEYIFWDNSKKLNFRLKNEKYYHLANNPAMASDILRYEIINRFGGFYLDADMIPLRKLDDINLDNNDFCIGEECGETYNNAAFYSEPDSPILHEIINRIPEIFSKKINTAEKTGPHFITPIIKKYPAKILDKKVFYPYNFHRRKDIPEDKQIIIDNYPEAIGCHAWNFSWNWT